MNTDQEKDIVSKYIKNKTEGTFLLAEHIVKKYDIVTVGEKVREMFVYKEGCYVPAENVVVGPEVQRILCHLVNKNAKGETYHKIADQTSHPREIFQMAERRYIPVKNGVYDIETDSLLPHEPKYRFTYQFPIHYDKNAQCTKTEAFFDQVLTPEQRLIIEEWLGYYFWRNYQFKKALILVGEGDTGKTTLLEVIGFLLGVNNLSSVSLQKMSSDKFSVAHLYGKHGNIVDELSAKDIHDTGAFKMATGGGSITGERKYGNQFSFINYSKFTFACNKIPDVKDTDDDAYFNRWMVIRFENKIEKKIPNFIETLDTSDERSGLFNLAMRGLKRLIAQGSFTYKLSASETKTEMMRSGSSIAMFASDILERDDSSEISKEDLYSAYGKYCRDNCLSTQSIRMFGAKVPSYTPYISDAVSASLAHGKRSTVRVWRNVKLKSVSTPGFGDFDNIEQYESELES